MVDAQQECWRCESGWVHFIVWLGGGKYLCLQPSTDVLCYQEQVRGTARAHSLNVFHQDVIRSPSPLCTMRGHRSAWPHDRQGQRRRGKERKGSSLRRGLINGRRCSSRTRQRIPFAALALGWRI